MPAQAYPGAPCVCHRALPSCDGSCTAELMATPSYVAALRLAGRRALVVGGGSVGAEKVDGLLACEAQVTLVSPEAEPALAELAREGAIAWERRTFAPDDVDGAFVVIAATPDSAVNISVYEACEARATLCNVADVPPLCSFILPAIVRTGPIAIAISTSGASPALAKRMRDEIAAAYGEPYAKLAEILNEARGWAKATLPTYGERKAFFESIVLGDPDPVALLRDGDEAAVRDLVARTQALAAPSARLSPP